MNKFKFIKYRNEDNEFDRTKVVHIVEAGTLPELLEAFEDFLKGCAFSFEGQLEVVEDENE